MTGKDETRLRHMLAQAQKLVARAKTMQRAQLDQDNDLAAALAWRLSIIGEAASRISQDVRDAHTEVPWTQMVGMRHRLIHGYDSIDLEVVWQTIQTDLPPLIAAIQNILPSS